MAFVDDDEVEKVLCVFAEVGRVARTTHEGLEDREKQTAVLRHPALLADLARLDPYQRVFRKRRERVECLIRQNVSIREKQNPRAARWLTRQVPAALKKFPRDLKRDECLARTSRQREQDAFALSAKGFQYTLHRDVLIVAALEKTAAILEGHCRKTIPPCILFREGEIPKILRRWINGNIAFVSVLHIDAIDALPVGGVSEADSQLVGISLGLRHAFGMRLVPCFGLDHRQLEIPIHQHVVRDLRSATLPTTLNAAGADLVLAQNATAFHDTPTRRLEGGVDVLGTGFGFVHGAMD